MCISCGQKYRRAMQNRFSRVAAPQETTPPAVNGEVKPNPNKIRRTPSYLGVKEKTAPVAEEPVAQPKVAETTVEDSNPVDLVE